MENLLNSKGRTTLYAKRARLMLIMRDIFKPRPSQYPTRKPYVPPANEITFGHNSIRVEGPKLLNILTDETENAENLSIFTSNIKTFNFPSCRCNNNCTGDV